MKRLILSSILGISLLLAFPLLASASVACEPIYGGQNCVQTGIVINKTVQDPQSGNYVDNLTPEDSKYNPSQFVNFKISVTNTGNTTIGKTTVSDIFPADINFTAGPGSFNPKTNTLSFTVDDLNINETRTFTLTGQVVSNDQLPPNAGIVCVVNQAETTTDSGDQSQDSAQLCIQKQTAAITVPGTTKGGLKVFPAAKLAATPPTGPEALPLLALLPTGFIGMLFRKKSK